MLTIFGSGCAVAAILRPTHQPLGILKQKNIAQDFCKKLSAASLILNISVFLSVNFRACGLSFVLFVLAGFGHIRHRDPNQRLLLQTTLKCLGSSAISDEESGEVTGVFVGFCNNEWGRVSVGTGICIHRCLNYLDCLFCCRRSHECLYRQRNRSMYGS